jgi:hypothetical protein
MTQTVYHYLGHPVYGQYTECKERCVFLRNTITDLKINYDLNY